MTANAWIVTKGKYSSMEIVAVFTSEAVATAFCKPQWDYIDRAQSVRGWNSFDRYEIEEVPLNPVNEPEDTRLRFCISFNGAGDVTYTSVVEPDSERDPIRGWSDGRVEVDLYASSLEWAIKAAAERRAQWLVENEGQPLRRDMSPDVLVEFKDWLSALLRCR